MIDPGEVTPIERPLIHDGPLMRSDLNDVRKAMHNLEQIALRHYHEATATRREGRVLAVICVASALVSLGCAALGLS